MAPSSSSASYNTPSHDDDPSRHQLKILSPLPHVPWDHPPPLASGAGAGSSPSSSRHRHGNQAGDDNGNDGVYRRTRARSQKRLSFGGGSSSSSQQEQQEQQEQQVQQKVDQQQQRTGMARHMYLSRYDAPSYLVGNPYIHGGYRACKTLREACLGLLYHHNSWLDTWTSCFSWFHAHVLLVVAAWRYGVFGEDWLSAVVFALFYVHVAWVHAPASIICHLVRREGGREGGREGRGSFAAVSGSTRSRCVFLFLSRLLYFFSHFRWETLESHSTSTSSAWRWTT